MRHVVCPEPALEDTMMTFTLEMPGAVARFARIDSTGRVVIVRTHG
jgi:hypothetical protein